MPKISPQALKEVEQAFEDWKEEVEASNLTQSSKETYIGHPNHFVRWLNDDFVPGGSK